MINGEVIAVVVPAKISPFLCDADVVIDEKADLQQSYADHENWMVALFLNAAFFHHLVPHFSSQGKRLQLTSHLSNQLLAARCKVDHFWSTRAQASTPTVQPP